MNDTTQITGYYGRRKAHALNPVLRGSLEDVIAKYALNLEELRNSDRPLCLEIGFGYGEHLAAQAAAHSECLFIGVEAFINGAAHCARTVLAAGLDNVRVAVANVHDLMQGFADFGKPLFMQTAILFADPWPKKRHNKRRLIRLPFLQKLAQLMHQGGELRIATDHQGYLEHIMEVIDSEPCRRLFTLKAVHTDSRPDEQEWPRTRYEMKAQEQGRQGVFIQLIRTQDQ